MLLTKVTINHTPVLLGYQWSILISGSSTALASL